MVEKLTIKNFRGLSDLTLPLADFTLISGENNTGKTSVLEAVAFLFGHYREDIFQSLNSIRGIYETNSTARELWGWIFNDADIKKHISLSSLYNKENINIDCYADFNINNISTNSSSIDVPHCLKITCKYKKNIHFQTLFNYRINVHGKDEINYSINSLDTNQRYVQLNFPNIGFLTGATPNMAHLHDTLGTINRKRQKDIVVDFIRSIDGRIKDVMPGDNKTIYIEVEGISYPIPLSYMGSATSTLLHWIMYVLTQNGNLLLIDEIGSGIHHSCMEMVISKLCDICRTCNCQIIATTHSLDCVQAFANCADKEVKRQFIRLERDKKNKVIAKAIDEEQLKLMVVEEEWEVR